ncbi:MAG: hypothetical protein K5905_22195 [Roseibium sp.]|uniref:hypothetical protein n=1 Tax=Roseibium sp. TaxID=1936156 RepID=UPI002629E47E|nr:hypothetical protein [Roseibium sp.]MCV0428177.1 hypothetical protein [Roseibium sp.]
MIVLAIAAIVQSTAVDDRPLTQLPYLAWGAWECATALEYTDNVEADRSRYVELGINAARRFLEAEVAGEVSPEVWGEEVPVAFGLRIGGPSIDFIVGRWFEAAISTTFDDIHNAIPTELTYAQREEIRSLNAERLYRDRNCQLL